jgi:hypothetical protein
MCYWFYLPGQPAGSRNQLARSEFRRGADISSQATLYNSTPLSGQSICRSNARAAASKFCLARKEPPRQVRRSRKLLEDFQMRLQDDGVELYWPRLTLRKHLPVTACLRRGRLVFYIWGHSSTARWSRLWPMLTRPLLPSPLQESERKRRTRPRVIASPLSYYQTARHIMRDDTAWFRSCGYLSIRTVRETAPFHRRLGRPAGHRRGRAFVTSRDWPSPLAWKALGRRSIRRPVRPEPPRPGPRSCTHKESSS